MSASSSPTREPTRLLERSAELGALDDYFAAVSRTSRGRLVFIGGESGVGKTALIQHFCDSLGRGTQILRGSCDALFTPRPLGPFVDIAQITGGELEDCGQRGGRPYEVVTALMRELRSRAPALLVVEDVHWADEATLDVLRLLGRRVETVPALVLASYRNDALDRAHPLRILLGELRDAHTIARLQVPTLSPAAVAQLAEPHGIDAVDLYRKTAGNAFFVTEALAAGDAEIPVNVRDAVLARAARLAPSARMLLEAVAVVPPQAEVWLLAGIAGDVLDQLDACLDSGILTAQSGAVAFRHELARLTIDESITPIRRAALHRAALQALAAPPVGAPDLARLAHHAEAAADTEAVLRFAPAAAERAALLGAHREAAAEYARALLFAHALPAPARAAFLERQAYECFLTDQVELSITAGRAAVQGFHEAGDRLREGDAMRQLSHHLRCTGVPGGDAESDAIGRRAVALLEHPSLPAGHELAMAYANVAVLSLNADDVQGTIAHGHRALRLAEELGDAEVHCHALDTLGTMEMLDGAPEGRAKLERCIALALEAGLEEQAGRAYLNLGWAANRTRAYAGVERQLRAGLDYCAEHGLVLWRRYVLTYLARLALDLGRWSEAVELAQEVLADPATVLPRVPALVVIGLVRARRGDPGRWPPLNEALAIAQRTGELQHVAPVAAAQAEAAWLEGRLDLVGSVTEAALELATRRQAAWVVGELACWRWRAGLPPGARDASAEPYALEMAGSWTRSAELWAQRGCPYEVALALASADDDDAGQRQALAELQRLGARATASAVSRRLRELGTRGLPRGPRPNTRTNAAHLTARQLEILELLVDGLRNGEIAERLFVSARTVDHHVSAILGKLGVRSRTEASRQAARLGVLSDAVRTTHRSGDRGRW